MTFTEITMQDAAERRAPAAEIDWSPDGAQPEPAPDVFADLRQHLERRARLIELIVGRERAIDDAYDSRAENRIAWARTEGAETLRMLRGGLLSCEATIKHLCHDLGKEIE